jgi:hypothetical protein
MQFKKKQKKNNSNKLGLTQQTCDYSHGMEIISSKVNQNKS